MAITVVRPEKARRCGPCSTGHHATCTIGVRVHRHAGVSYPEGAIHPCLCEDGGCEPGRRKCTYCNNRNTSDVDPTTWECFDLDLCRATVEARREANPLLRQLREAQENAAMAKIEASKEKAEKVAKTKEPTFCLVTGEPTKGGLFKPGMDARYVSERVTEVLNGKFSKKAEDAARAKMKKDGVSEKLVAKFDKSLGLAREKQEKRDAAKAEKAEAKANA